MFTRRLTRLRQIVSSTERKRRLMIEFNILQWVGVRCRCSTFDFLFGSHAERKCRQMIGLRWSIDVWCWCVASDFLFWSGAKWIGWLMFEFTILYGISIGSWCDAFDFLLNARAKRIWWLKVGLRWTVHIRCGCIVPYLLLWFHAKRIWWLMLEVTFLWTVASCFGGSKGEL